MSQLLCVLMVTMWVSLWHATCDSVVSFSSDTPLRSWANGGALGFPVSHSSTVLFNDSLLVIGGCLSVDCTLQSASVSAVPLLSADSPTGDVLSTLSFPVAGHHAAVTFAGLIYVVRSCSLWAPDPPPPHQHEHPNNHHATQTATNTAATSLLLDALSVVTEYDPETGFLNDSFFQIPLEYVRANASCVNVGNLIYVVGGVNMHSGTMANTIDAIDVVEMVYMTNVSTLDEPLSLPSLGTDATSLYIAHFTSSAMVPSSSTHIAVWRFTPGIGVDGNVDCLEMLPPLSSYGMHCPNSGDHSCTCDLTGDCNGFSSLGVVAFAEALVIVNPWGTQGAMLSLRSNRSRLWNSWEMFSIASVVNASGPSPLPSLSNASVVAPNATVYGSAVYALATYEGNVTSSNTVHHSTNQSTPATSVGSALTIFRVGGVIRAVLPMEGSSNITLNVSTLTTSTAVTSARINSSALVLPLSNLHNQVVSTSMFQLNLVGGSPNITSPCNLPIRTTPCRIRLSSRPDCLGNAAGTFDAPWDGTHSVVFTPTGASSPVYVCLTLGGDPYNLCDGSQLPAVYYNTNPLWPLSLQNTPLVTPVPATVAPPASPSPAPAGSHGPTITTLLYVFGGVALVTTIVAVLLVSKLRRVPDEGLAGPPHLAGGGLTVGYGTHQEERYKTIGKIGEGAFSTVYLVARRTDGIKFAMKHMECQSDVQRQEAIKECEIIRSLQGHANVINLFDMFMNYEFDATPAESPSASVLSTQEPLLSKRHGGKGDAKLKLSRHLCLVMEYHPAGDLRRWALHHRGLISEQVLSSIAFQVASLLHHIHSEDPAVIHRDLKPENILIVTADSGTSNPSRPPQFYEDSLHSSRISFLPIVITDFGLARIQESAFCASGAGTLPYVAPECFKKKYTTQCDLWSLGCVLYAVATKRVNHDNVRLMFQDCEKPNFKDMIASDLRAVGLSDIFIALVLMLIDVDVRTRLTAKDAVALFRKQGDTVRLSRRTVLKLADDGRRGGSLRSPEARATRESIDARVLPSSEQSLNHNDDGDDSAAEGGND